MSGMRRLLALLLAAVFCSSPFLFAALSGGETSVPVCCRRLGAHHCSMHAALDSRRDQIGARCPYSGLRRPEAVITASGLIKPASQFGVESTAGYQLLRTEQPVSLIAIQRSHPKRGPPHFSLK